MKLSPSISRLPNRRAIVLSGLALLAGLSACGRDDAPMESTVRYEPPLERRIVVETVVDLPFDRAWDELIRRLSESGFSVSTLEKASRFVVVEMRRSSDLAASANQPGRYVDCGRTFRTLTRGGKEERFEYDVARSSRHSESDPIEGGFRVSDVDRRVELEAKASLYLQPEGPRRTRVTLNARYQIRFEISGSAIEILDGESDSELEAQAFGPRVESIRFSTFEPGQDRRSGGLTCRATGEFEHALIALANPAAAI